MNKTVKDVNATPVIIGILKMVHAKVSYFNSNIVFIWEQTTIVSKIKTSTDRDEHIKG